MPYLNIRQFAATKAESTRETMAPSTRKELWEILKIVEKAEVGLEGRAGTKNHALSYNTEGDHGLRLGGNIRSPLREV